jgi:hypothetical protein
MFVTCILCASLCVYLFVFVCFFIFPYPLHTQLYSFSPLLPYPYPPISLQPTSSHSIAQGKKAYVGDIVKASPEPPAHLARIKTDTNDIQCVCVYVCMCMCVTLCTAFNTPLLSNFLPDKPLFLCVLWYVSNVYVIQIFCLSGCLC